jgi:hypothetical protein
VTNAVNDELEGNTLNVYAYAVKEGKPVGPRDVMRGVNLSSPSVAYRQLQKLENLGLLERTQYGEYVVKEKTNISGHLWIGRNLVPRLVFYSFFFMGILGAEIAIIAAQLFFYGQSLDMEIFYLIAITAIAMSMFLGEGILLHRKTRPEKQTKD